MTVDEFIAKWEGTIGGAEKKNLPLFIGDLCAVLGVDPQNEPTSGGTPGVMMTTSRMMGTFRSDERSRREVLALMGY